MAWPGADGRRAWSLARCSSSAQATRQPSPSRPRPSPPSSAVPTAPACRRRTRRPRPRPRSGARWRSSWPPAAPRTRSRPRSWPDTGRGSCSTHRASRPGWCRCSPPGSGPLLLAVWLLRPAATPAREDGPTAATVTQPEGGPSKPARRAAVAVAIGLVILLAIGLALPEPYSLAAETVVNQPMAEAQAAEAQRQADIERLLAVVAADPDDRRRALRPRQPVPRRLERRGSPASRARPAGPHRYGAG